MRYAKNNGSVGIGIQEAKGTAVYPEMYIKASESTTLTPTIEVDQQREGGDGIYPGTTVKTLQKLDGSVALNVRPDILTLLVGGMFGVDAVSGASVPYTHVMTPNTSPTTNPWFTIVRDVAGQIKERFTDCRLKELVISGESGGRITASASVLGLTSEIESTHVHVPVYESNSMFMFYNGTFTKDGSSVPINKFDITIRAIVDEGDQTTGIELADAPVIRYECEVSMGIDVDSSNISEYTSVLYSGGSAATSLHSGTFTVDLGYGTGSDERQFKAELHKVVYTEQPIEWDPQSDERHIFELNAVCEKHDSNGLVTVTTKSGRATGPSATRGTATLTLTGNVVDTETVTINGRVYEMSSDGSIEAGSDVEVDVSSALDADTAVTALAAAINGDSDADVAAEADTGADKVVVTAKAPGTVGNYTVSTSLTNGSWGGAELAGGTNNG